MRMMKTSVVLAAAMTVAQAGWAEEVRVYNWSD